MISCLREGAVWWSSIVQFHCVYSNDQTTTAWRQWVGLRRRVESPGSRRREPETGKIPPEARAPVNAPVRNHRTRWSALGGVTQSQSTQNQDAAKPRER